MGPVTGVVGPSIECGIIPEGRPVFAALRRGPAAVDPERFRRAADRLDAGERFAGPFLTEPRFQAPADVPAELRRRCPDLLG